MKLGVTLKKVATSVHGARARMVGGNGVGVMWWMETDSIIGLRFSLKGLYLGEDMNFWCAERDVQSVARQISAFVLFIQAVEGGVGTNE